SSSNRHPCCTSSSCALPNSLANGPNESTLPKDRQCATGWYRRPTHRPEPPLSIVDRFGLRLIGWPSAKLMPGCGSRYPPTHSLELIGSLGRGWFAAFVFLSSVYEHPAGLTLTTQ